MKQMIETLRLWGADIEGAMGRFLDDEEFYIDCLHRFVNDGNLRQLKKAVDEENRENIFECSHSLKGTVGTLGLAPLYEKISALVEDSRFELKNNVKQDYEQFNDKYLEFLKIMQET
ncbi:MAG: Hpt domain-containing protein [Faecalicoccus sp.]|nr:Hpt domain-containing protein [Faecalicoccus sp.]